MRLEPAAAASVIGVAAYELWKAWNDNAPSIREMRAAPPGDTGMRQALLDANLTVGSLAVIIGVTFAVLTKDLSVLLIMLVIFGTLSFMHSWILASTPQ